ncbi:hypothetical protein [Photobacterium damselae]|uniref:hypothetical protein n=1 Tax=Photobacterium damselae TaxID=38293 RepID=UPI0010FDE762|nr:hypothetical protein [Photobacterium damselae]TLS73435.1 hypothetical protein FD718_01980 [Photobacterium damselae subsp. damselae]
MNQKLKSTLFNLLKKYNLLPENVIAVSMLDKGRGLEKQLDEYRELLERIEKETGYFSSNRFKFSACHAKNLDDYLSHLYELRFNKKPNPDTANEYLRKAPDFYQNDQLRN